MKPALYVEDEPDDAIFLHVARALKAYWLTFDQMVDEMGLGIAPPPTAVQPRNIVH